MTKLTDDTIRWILDMDANGVQIELKTISSLTQKLTDDNKRMAAELAAAEKQFKEVGKALDKLEQSGKQNTKEYQELLSTYQSVSNEITDYKRRILENTRAIADNNEKHKQVISTMKIEDMTMSQLKQRAAMLAKQLDDTSKTASPETYKKLEEELNSVKRRMGDLGGASSNFSGMMKNAFSVFAGNMLTKGIEMVGRLKDQVVQFFNESLEAATKADGVEKAFKRIADEKYLDKLREQTQGLVDDFNLMKAAVRAEQFRIPLSELGKLLDFAQHRAQDTGESVDYMVESLISGIGRKSALKLDNLGISAAELRVKLKETGDMALAVGKIIDEKMAGNTASIDTAAAAATRKKVAWDNLKLATGNFFVDFKKGWDSMVSNTVGGLAQILRGQDGAITSFNKQIDKVAELEVNIVPLVQRYDELKGKTSLNKKEQEELTTIMNTISKTIPGVTTAFDAYGNALGINTEKVYAYIEAEKLRLKYMNKEAIAEAAKNLQDAKTELAKVQNKLQNGAEYTVPLNPNINTPYKRAYTDEEIDDLKRQEAKLQKVVSDSRQVYKNLDGTAIEDMIASSKKKTEIENEFKNMTKKQLKAWIDDKKNANNEYKKLAEDIFKFRFDTPGEVTKTKKGKTEAEIEKQRLDTDLQNLETKHQKELSAIQEEYLKGNIKSESDRNAKIFAIDQSYYLLQEQTYEKHLGNVKKKTDEEKNLRSEIEKKMAELNTRRLEQENKFRDAIAKILLDADPVAKENKEYEERLRSIGLFGVERESMTADQKKALLILEEDHNKKLSDIQKTADEREKTQAKEDFEANFEIYKQQQEDIIAEEENVLAVKKELGTLSAAEIFEAEREIQLQKIALIQKEVEERDKAAMSTSAVLKRQRKEEQALTSLYIGEYKRRTQLYNQYGEQLGSALGNVLTGEQDALKGFADVVLDILFDTLTNIINAKIAEATAVAIAEQAKAAAISAAQPDSVATFGASGAARTAIISGIIMAALAAAKATLKNLIKGGKDSSSSSSSGGSGTYVTNSSGYADGGFHTGYTGDGSKYEVKGYFPDGQPYHAGEYIIPQEVLAVPEVVQMIRRIEPIRKQKVSDNNSLPEGFADGGFHTSGGRVSVVDSDRMDSLVSALEAFANKDLSFNYYQFEKTKNKVDASRLLGKKR